MVQHSAAVSIAQSHRLIWVAAAAGLVLGGAVTGLLLRQPQKTADVPTTPKKSIASSPVTLRELPASESRRMAEIIAQVQREYVDEVTPDRLLEQAMRGMVGSLDPYSAYLDRREYEELRRGAAGSYPGIGIEVSAEGEGIKVVRSLADSPAARAGIRGGDVILQIDNEPVGSNVNAALEQMRGPPGSLVRLTLRRAESAELVSVALERAKVEVHSVTGELLEPGFAYVRIASFSETTRKDFEKILRELTATGRLRGLVLDVRHNPGGVLEAAVEVADTLLDTGNIVSATGRTAEANFRMDATRGQLLEGVPLVLLINGASASAAEILAGALKDNGRARLVGRRTYGKGVVQSVLPLADGRALKLTTSRYVTPAGVSIDETGIEPDVLLPGVDMTPLAARDDAEVKLALRSLREPANTRGKERR
ncbi:MAG: S41 family peptidase [Steroidobacteraceae bacterium]